MTVRMFLACMALLLVLNGCQDRPTLPAASSGHDTVPFAGVYLSKAYHSALLQHRSPCKAASAGEWQLVIPEHADGEVFGGYNSHEGMEPCRLAHQSTNWELVCPPPDGVRKIVPLGAYELQIGSEVLVRVDRYQPSYTSLAALPNYKNQLLLAGNYRKADGTPVRFLPDGTVKGLETLGVKYEVWQDYVGPGSNVDQVAIGSGRDNRKLSDYGFSWSGDILTLHKITCTEKKNDECLRKELSEVVARLNRERLQQP